MTKEELIDFIKSTKGHWIFKTESGKEVSEEQIIKVLEQQPCEDCISRAKALEMLGDEPENWTDTEKEIQEVNDYRWFKSILEELPSVTPQQQMGKWLAKSFHEVYCDNCGFDFDIMTNKFIDKMKYCPNCGAKMEVEE